MPSEFKSLKGCLLLDAGGMNGSCFHHAVILVCQHTQEGAFGLVLNQTSDKTDVAKMGVELPTPLNQLPLRLGGPVDPSTLSYLHSDSFMFQGNVMANLTLGHDLSELADIGNSFTSHHQVEIYSGYSGWGPGQMESELERKAWLVHPAKTNHVFENKGEELWRSILRNKGWQYKLLACVIIHVLF